MLVQYEQLHKNPVSLTMGLHELGNVRYLVNCPDLLELYTLCVLFLFLYKTEWSITDNCEYKI